MLFIYFTEFNQYIMEFTQLNIINLDNYCKAKILSFLDIKDIIKLYLFFKELRSTISNYDFLIKYLSVNSNISFTKHNLNCFYDKIINPIVQDDFNKIIEVVRNCNKYEVSNFIVNSYSNSWKVLNEIKNCSEEFNINDYCLITLNNLKLNRNLLTFNNCNNVKIIKCVLTNGNQLQFNNCDEVIFKDNNIRDASKIKIVDCKSVSICTIGFFNIFLNITTDKIGDNELKLSNLYVNSSKSNKIYGYNKVSIDNIWICGKYLNIVCPSNDKNTITISNSYISTNSYINIVGYKKVIINKCIFISPLVIDLGTELYVNNVLTNINVFNNIENNFHDFFNNIFCYNPKKVDLEWNYDFIEY